MLTGRDVYRMLVRERGWSAGKYQHWVADALVQSLLIQGRANPVRSWATKSGSSQEA
jgi:prophage antirepressor-like protein